MHKCTLSNKNSRLNKSWFFLLRYDRTYLFYHIIIYYYHSSFHFFPSDRPFSPHTHLVYAPPEDTAGEVLSWIFLQHLILGTACSDPFDCFLAAGSNVQFILLLTRHAHPPAADQCFTTYRVQTAISGSPTRQSFCKQSKLYINDLVFLNWPLEWREIGDVELLWWLKVLYCQLLLILDNFPISREEAVTNTERPSQTIITPPTSPPFAIPLFANCKPFPKS